MADFLFRWQVQRATAMEGAMTKRGNGYGGDNKTGLMHRPTVRFPVTVG